MALLQKNYEDNKGKVLADAEEKRKSMEGEDLKIDLVEIKPKGKEKPALTEEVFQLIKKRTIGSGGMKSLDDFKKVKRAMMDLDFDLADMDG